MITDDMIRCWRTNYGIEDNTPAEAAAWWEEKLGHAPSGAVAALGTCIEEIKRLQRALRDHLESESAETMRADALRSERDDWQALAAAADADKRKAEKELAAARAELAAEQNLLGMYVSAVEELRHVLPQFGAVNGKTWDEAVREQAQELAAARADLAAARALLLGITSAYNAYRRRGVYPAPTEYEDVVRAILKADAALVEEKK